MGNCCGSESKEELDQHQLKPTANKKSNNKGQTLGGSSDLQDGSNSREAMLKAAEKRKQEADNRGVKDGGGKLSKKLQEQKKTQTPVTDQASEKLVWD